MASHIELANRNQAVIDYLLLNPSVCAETIAVISFYKALHVMEAIFCFREQKHCFGHVEREKYIKNHKVYSQYWPFYRVLSTSSYVARYLADNTTSQGYTRFSDYLPLDQVKAMLLDRYLARLERLAVTMLPSSHGLVPYTPRPIVST